MHSNAYITEVCCVSNDLMGTAIIMAHTWFLYSVFFASLVPQSSALCGDPLSEVERYLYAQLEDALVTDAATLEQLREVFFQEPPRSNKIQFHINVTADSISPSNCSECLPSAAGETCTPAFCLVDKTASDSNTSTAQWELCSHMKVTWKVPRDVDAVDLIQVLADTVVPWCTHGISLVAYTNSPFARGDNYYFYNTVYRVQDPIKLSLMKLDLSFILI